MANNNNISSSSSGKFRTPSWENPEKAGEIIDNFMKWHQNSKRILLRAPSANKAKLLPREEVLEKLEEEQKHIKDDTLLLVSPTNTTFDEDTQRIALVDNNKLYKPQEVTKKAYSCAADIVKLLCEHNKKRTLRGLFYMCRNVFRTQTRSNEAINNLCRKIGATRPSLNISAGDRGFVIGPLTYMLYGKRLIDCNSESDSEILTKVGQIVPPYLSSVSDMRSERAKFVLVVESLSVYDELAGENFHDQYDCIIMTGKGMSDLALREFAKYVMEKLNIPLFLLSDSDPWGIEIYAVYKYGSQNMAFDSDNLANPLIYWVGIWPTDLTTYDIQSEDLSPDEEKKASQLLGKDFVTSDEMLKKELKHMVKHKKKASICAMSQFGLDGLTGFLLSKLCKMMVDIMESKL